MSSTEEPKDVFRIYYNVIQSLQYQTKSYRFDTCEEAIVKYKIQKVV